MDEMVVLANKLFCDEPERFKGENPRLNNVSVNIGRNIMSKYIDGSMSPKEFETLMKSMGITQFDDGYYKIKLRPEFAEDWKKADC